MPSFRVNTRQLCNCPDLVDQIVLLWEKYNGQGRLKTQELLDAYQQEWKNSRTAQVLFDIEQRIDFLLFSRGGVCLFQVSTRRKLIPLALAVLVVGSSGLKFSLQLCIMQCILVP